MTVSPTFAKARNLVLVGYRGSGKSTVGKELARTLGLGFLDTDLVIQEKQGRSIREIFSTDGEPAFRNLESQSLEDLLADQSISPSVIATGGGIVMRSENRDNLRLLGMVIWLEVSPEMAIQRISGDSFTTDQRPSLTSQSLSEEVRKMIAERTPVYASVADMKILNNDNSRDTEAIVQEIIGQLKQTSWYSDHMKQIDS
jgi:shikimate kinase